MAFLKSHKFGDSIFLEKFLICSKTTLSNIFETIGNKLIGRQFALLFGSSLLNTGMTSATFNSSGKDFVEIHFLIQFVIGIKITFSANLIMAGDISPLEFFLMCLKILTSETNSNLKLKYFLNFPFIVLILG